MTIQDMHYDFKVKFNKLDSAQNRNFLVPEIDWLLNEAQNLFVKWVANPRLKGALGFETSQRSTDEIRVLVQEVSLPVTKSVAKLPENYWFHVKSHALISKGRCKNKRAKVYLRQHDDRFEDSPFDNSSFLWRTVNAVFDVKGVRFFTDGEAFTVDTLVMSYVRKMEYIHFAAGFSGGKYSLPSGTLLEGSKDCELPDSTHAEIVDIAVALAQGQINSPGFEYAAAKLNLNNLK